MNKWLIVVVLLYLGGFWDTTKSEAAGQDKKSPRRGTFVIEHAEDRELCEKMVWKRKLFGKTAWTLITPLEATVSLFGSGFATGTGDVFREGSTHYVRGSFDFDNDGIRDTVYASGSYGTTFFVVKPNDIDPNAPRDEISNQMEAWPEGFGIDWLTQRSRSIYPEHWVECSQTEDCLYTPKHYREATLSLLYLQIETFRYRNVTYLLSQEILPKGPDSGIHIVFRPTPTNIGDE